MTPKKAFLLTRINGKNQKVMHHQEVQACKDPHHSIITHQYILRNISADVKLLNIIQTKLNQTVLFIFLNLSKIL